MGATTFTAEITSSSPEQFSVTLMEATHGHTTSAKRRPRCVLIDGQRVVLGYHQTDAAELMIATEQSEVNLTNTDLIPPESAEDAQGVRCRRQCTVNWCRC